MAKPLRVTRTIGQKLTYLDYAEIHNNSIAARDLATANFSILACTMVRIF